MNITKVLQWQWEDRYDLLFEQEYFRNELIDVQYTLQDRYDEAFDNSKDDTSVQVTQENHQRDVAFDVDLLVYSQFLT